METARGLLRGLQTQFTVIHALILRETRTRFGENRLGYLWAVLEPLLVILTFYAAFLFMERPLAAGMDHVTFIATGWLPFELIMSSAERGAEAINGNRNLLYYPQVQTLDLLFARSLLEASTLIVVFVAILAGNALILDEFVIDDVLGVMIALLTASFLGTSLGLVYCMLGLVSSMMDRIRGPLTRPLFWISGIFFTAAELPDELRDLAMLNPILHVIEMLRGAWSPYYDATDASAGYVLAWAFALLALGLLLERALRRRVGVA